MNYDLHPRLLPFMNSLNAAYGPHASAVLMAGIVALIVWTIAWKGFGLWYAARNNQKVWFFFMLVVNLLGLLEIIYLLFGRKNKNNTVTTTTVTHTTVATSPEPVVVAAGPATDMPSLAPIVDHTDHTVA